MSDHVGRVVGGYRIQEILGRGGMGVVYAAVQEPLGRRVALKLVSLEREPDAPERFRREWRLAAALNHPNVLPIYDAGKDDGVLFMAMRLVEGPDLGGLIARDGPLAPMRAAALVSQVGAALDAAHVHGLVHRDVKPANILVQGAEPDEHAYLSDFGAVKRHLASRPLTKAGHWLGTLGYVAPEQLRGESVDGRADLYALGCVLFEALTGRVPFPRDDDAAVMWAHLSDPPPRASEALRVPVGLDTVLERALAKEPARRYASGDELAKAVLRAARGPTPTSASTALRPLPSPAGPLPRAFSWRRRGLAVGATAAAAVVVAAAGGVVALREEESPPGVPTAPTTAGSVIGKPIDVTGQPLNIAVSPEAVWVTTAGDNGVARVDPAASATAAQPIAMGAMPYGIAADGGSVWVTTPEDGTVRRIDARTGGFVGRPVRVGGKPLGVAIGAGAVWVAQLDSGTVTRIDPRTLARSRIRVGGHPLHIAVGAGSVWVTVGGEDTLARIDPRTSKLVGRPIPVGDNPTDVAVGDGIVWVTARDDSALVRVDARTSRTIGRPIPVGDDPYDVAVGAGGVWVTSHGEDTVRRLDPKTGRMVGAPLPVGDGARDVAVGDGTVWVSNTTDGTMSRIEPAE